MFSMKFIILIVFLLVSCGGGGGGSSSPNQGGSNSPTITVSLSPSLDSVEVNSTVTLTWSSTSANSCSASGSWSGVKSTSGTETVTISLGGPNNFSLTCSATGAISGSASTSVNGLRYISGRVFDGYIRGAEIFIDENNNLSLDENEVRTSSANDGSFENLLYANGTLVSVGGFDLDTGADLSNLTLENRLSGFEPNKLISPFTTLIAYMEDSSNLNQILEIDASINLMTVDPIPFLGEGIYDKMYEKGNQLTVLSYSLQNYFDETNSKIYFQAIAAKLEDEFAANESAVDIETADFVTKVIDEVETTKSEAITEEAQANLTTVISSVLPAIRVNADSAITTAVQRFAFNRMQEDIKDGSIIASNTSPTLEKYEQNIFAYIATDQSIDEASINPDFNSAPQILSNSSFSVEENQSSIGTVSATDAEGDSLSFSVSGNEILISSSGVLTFAALPDYETKNLYSIVVTVSDGVNFVSQTINIVILDVDESTPNQAPTITSLNTFSAEENQLSIGNIIAADADGDPLAYSISGSEINISNTGILTFATAPDYETKNSYTASVSVSDGTDVVTQNITISITDIDEIGNAPIFTSLALFNVNENQLIIGTVSASDADGDSLQYSLDATAPASNCNQNPCIYLDASSGVLSFGTQGAVAPDFELTPAYTFNVRVTDGINTTTQQITVNINNLNDNSPIISSSELFTANENQTSIGSVSASDADGDSLAYSISGSEINISNTGILTFATAPDYETKNSYTATVTVTDGFNSVVQNIAVGILDILENVAPSISGLASSIAVNENQTSVVTVTATDPNGDTLSYSLTGTDASSLSIDASGVITFDSAPDYETKTSYSVTVNVSDEIESVSQTISININNLNDISPTINSSATFNANENQTAIGAVSANDLEGDSITFSISGSEITIDASSGVLAFASAPNFESKSTYTATVTASDGSNATTQNITVNINNLNDNSPIFTSSTTFNVDENQINIGTASVSDADGDSITYSISGSELLIDSSSGALTFASSPDYENKTSYTATLTASDGSNATTQNITVNINNLNEITASVNLSISAIKSFAFSWSDTDDATSYKLLERINPSSSYTQVGNDINPGVQSYQYIAPLYSRVNASYILQSCYNTNCLNSDAVSVSGNLAQAIGYVKASNSGADDQFGSSLSLSGDGNTLAVAAIFDDSNATGINGDDSNDNATRSGAVYVFVRSGSSWTQQAYVKASNTQTEDVFGQSLSLSDDGNTLAVGAPYEDSRATGINGNQTTLEYLNGNSGAVYVFTRSGTNWSQEAYIKASNNLVLEQFGGDAFGQALSLSGDGNTLAVGASSEDGAWTQSGFDEDDNSSRNAGAAYVFVRSGTTWTQQAYLKDSNSISNDGFGSDLSLSDDGNTLAISRHGWDAGTGGNNAGSVLIFTRTGTTWNNINNNYIYSNLIASNPDPQDFFGFSISLSGDGNTLAVGAWMEDSDSTGIGGDQSNNNLTNSGAVYIFSRSGNSWSQQAYLKSSSTGDRDYFGTSVSLTDDGNTLAVSSYLEDGNAVGMGGDPTNNAASNSGGLFVFSRSGSSWSEIAYVKSSNTEAGDCFGRNRKSVDLSDNGNTLAVGNYCEDSNATGIGGNQSDNSLMYAGAAYIY